MSDISAVGGSDGYMLCSPMGSYHAWCEIDAATDTREDTLRQHQLPVRFGETRHEDAEELQRHPRNRSRPVVASIQKTPRKGSDEKA